MKIIPETLIDDLQVLIDNAIHLRHTWAQVAEVKRALVDLEDFQERQSQAVEAE